MNPADQFVSSNVVEIHHHYIQRAFSNLLPWYIKGEYLVEYWIQGAFEDRSLAFLDPFVTKLQPHFDIRIWKLQILIIRIKFSSTWNNEKRNIAYFFWKNMFSYIYNAHKLYLNFLKEKSAYWEKYNFSKKRFRRYKTTYEQCNITWFPVDIFSFKIPRLQESQRQYGITRMIAQRAQEFSAFILSRWFKSLPKRRFLR